MICYLSGKTDESYSIPDSVTSIGNYAFLHCRNLKNIIVPNSVTSIGLGAFNTYNPVEVVHNLTLTFDGTVEDWLSISFGHNGNTSIGGDYVNITCSDGVVFNNGPIVMY